MPRQLSFDAAQRIFLENNPDLLGARARAEQEEHEARIPALWPNPSLVFQRNQTSPPGGGIGSENTLALEQPLRYPGEHGNRRSAAKKRAAAAYARYEEEAAALYAELRTRYATGLVAGRQLDVLGTVTAAMRRAVEIGEIRFQEGDISPFEQARLRVALATYEDELEAAKKDHRDALIELAYFLSPRSHAGHHEAEEVLLVLTDSLAYEPLALDYDALVEQALARRGLLAAAAAETRAREQVLRAERYARLPDLAVTAGYRDERQPGFVAPGFTVVLQVGLPVFHQRQPQVRAARAATVAARYEAEQARRRVELDVHDAYERLVSYQTRLDRVAQDILAGSEGLLDDALFVYEEGEIDLVGLLDAVEATKTARLLRIELLAEYTYSRFALERALGVGPQDPSPFD
ncbi:MAG: TolC family protein [Bacteroidetes bacterium]|nr:TolC family protein [Bacteroidota bacterium]